MFKIIAPKGHIRLYEAIALSKFINNHINIKLIYEHIIITYIDSRCILISIHGFHFLLFFLMKRYFLETSCDL